MSLYFRLLWTLLRTWRLPNIDINDTLERTFRVLPNDLDVNRHMNNGRYLTMVDLLVIEYFARTGFLRVLLGKKWYPVLGGAIITYRRELGAFQQYTLRFRYRGSDEHWNYLHFEFIDGDGNVCAAGYSKGAAKSRRGLVPCAKCFEAMGIDADSKPIPDAVAHWIESERALVAGIEGTSSVKIAA